MEHTFSVQMESKRRVKQILVSNESQEHVLFEGSLVDPEDVAFTDAIVLEITGTEGVLRIELDKDRLERAINTSRGEG
jgi:hypothetical protein